MEQAVVMESERLWFRPLEPEADREKLYVWINRPEVRRFLELRIFPQSRESRERWIERFTEPERPEKEMRERVGLVFGPKGEDAPIGYAYLQYFNWHVREANGGLVIGDLDQRGKGYGREVTKRLLSYAFRELNLNRVSLQVHADHERAVDLWKSVGFQEEGRLRQAVFLGGEYRDLLLMAILRDEWETGQDRPCEKPWQVTRQNSV